MFCPNCGKENDPSVRHCTGCGSFIPDLSSEVSGGAGDMLDFSDQPVQAQPMTYQALSQDDISAMQNDDSRYREYSMADVAAKKSRKGIVIAIIAAVGIIAVGLAAFFIIRAIIGGNALNSVREDPTKYVFDSYRATAASIAEDKNIIRSAIASTDYQKTTRTTVKGPGFSQTTTFSVDLPAKKAYSAVENYQEISKEMKKYYQGPEKVTAELYSTNERAVAKIDIDGKSYDYYLDLGNLREDAANSIFSPQGKNVLHIDQKTFDTAMDVYEFIYRNVTSESDPFGMKALAEKLSEDFNKSSEVSVNQEKADIDGTQTDAIVVTHTFTSADVIGVLVSDVRDWLSTSVNINDEINAMIGGVLDKVDIQQIISQINASVGNGSLKIRHYVNSDNALMQLEIIAEREGQGGKLVATFGADPASSKKITLKVVTTGGAAEAVLQTVTVANESDASEERFTATYTGMLVNGSTKYERNLASGDFTVTNEMSSTFSALSGALMTSDVVPSQRSTSPNFTYSGNLKTTDDSMTIVIKAPYGDGQEITYEYYMSGKAEIKELTSDNNILTADADEFAKIFPGFSVPAAA